jgi:hypothetical protein
VLLLNFCFSAALAQFVFELLQLLDELSHAHPGVSVIDADALLA